MEPLEQQLAVYYDQDAPVRAELPLGEDRTRWQQRFVDLLAAEGRTTVVELGCGPGRDAPGFLAAELRAFGLDLSVEHARLATAAGMPAVRGSLLDPPFRPATFDAAWSMSTLVHVPDERFDDALGAITAIVRPGAPIGLGLWGGVDHEGLSEQDRFQPPRFYSRRGHDRIQRMLAGHGEVESFETRDFGNEGWAYQFAILRRR